MSDHPRGTRRALFPSSVSRPVVSPLQPSVVYASPDPDTLDMQYEGGAKGYTYAREAHPNAELLEPAAAWACSVPRSAVLW